MSGAGETKLAFRYRWNGARGDLPSRFLNGALPAQSLTIVINPANYWTLGLIIFFCASYSPTWELPCCSNPMRAETRNRQRDSITQGLGDAAL